MPPSLWEACHVTLPVPKDTLVRVKRFTCFEVNVTDHNGGKSQLKAEDSHPECMIITLYYSKLLMMIISSLIPDAPCAHWNDPFNTRDSDWLLHTVCTMWPLRWPVENTWVSKTETVQENQSMKNYKDQAGETFSKDAFHSLSLVIRGSSLLQIQPIRSWSPDTAADDSASMTLKYPVGTLKKPHLALLADNTSRAGPSFCHRNDFCDTLSNISSSFFNWESWGVWKPLSAAFLLNAHHAWAQIDKCSWMSSHFIHIPSNMLHYYGAEWLSQGRILKSLCPPSLTSLAHDQLRPLLLPPGDHRMYHFNAQSTESNMASFRLKLRVGKSSTQEKKRSNVASRQALRHQAPSVLEN